MYVSAFGVLTRGMLKEKKHFSQLLESRFSLFCDEVLHIVQKKRENKGLTTELALESTNLENQKDIDYFGDKERSRKIVRHNDANSLPSIAEAKEEERTD